MLQDFVMHLSNKTPPSLALNPLIIITDRIRNMLRKNYKYKATQNSIILYSYPGCPVPYGEEVLREEWVPL